MHVKRSSLVRHTPHSPSTRMLLFTIVNRKRLLSLPNAGSCHARQTALNTLKDIGIRKGLCAHWPGREAYTVKYSTPLIHGQEEYSSIVRLLQRNDRV